MSQTLVIAIVVVAIIVAVVLVALALSRRRSRLRDLEPEVRARYAASWRDIEARFIDHPREAVAEADRLVMSLLRERGHPVEDERRMPGDVRGARHAMQADESGTEGMRRAMLRYRKVVDDAVGSDRRQRVEGRNREIAS